MRKYILDAKTNALLLSLELDRLDAVQAKQLRHEIFLLWRVPRIERILRGKNVWVHKRKMRVRERVKIWWHQWLTDHATS